MTVFLYEFVFYAFIHWVGVRNARRDTFAQREFRTG